MTSRLGIGGLGVLLLLLLLPLAVFAHETHIYDINGVEYEIVVGSLNEPVIVDDKTGVELEIVRDGELLVGAQDTIQVEMIAGAKKKIDNIQPKYGVEGAYKTNFIATVPTTLSYRVFGTLEGIAFDQTYTCNPVGHPASEENTERIEVSEGVIQTLARGNFGCPQPKEEFGFPEPAVSGVMLAQASQNPAKDGQPRDNRDTEKKDKGAGKFTLLCIAIGASLLSLLVSLFLLVRSRRSTKIQSTIVN